MKTYNKISFAYKDDYRLYTLDEAKILIKKRKKENRKKIIKKIFRFLCKKETVQKYIGILFMVIGLCCTYVCETPTGTPDGTATFVLLLLGLVFLFGKTIEKEAEF